MDILGDLEKLQINPDELNLKFKQLQGTRHIIQYENKDYVFSLSKTFKPKIEAIGVTNRCQDGRFVLFLEYDHIYKKIVYKNLQNLIKQFPKCFDNFFIAKTEDEFTSKAGQIKGSYHVINFVKNYKYQMREFMKITDIDPKYLEIPEKTAHKCPVLRISNKVWKCNGLIQKQAPAFIEMYPLRKIESGRPISTPHYKLFQKYWRMEDAYWAYRKMDSLQEIEFCKYSTPKTHGNSEKK